MCFIVLAVLVTNLFVITKVLVGSCCGSWKSNTWSKWLALPTAEQEEYKSKAQHPSRAPIKRVKAIAAPTPQAAIPLAMLALLDPISLPPIADEIVGLAPPSLMEGSCSRWPLRPLLLAPPFLENEF